jgi:hypothetical protein
MFQVALVGGVRCLPLSGRSALGIIGGMLYHGLDILVMIARRF